MNKQPKPVRVVDFVSLVSVDHLTQEEAVVIWSMLEAVRDRCEFSFASFAEANIGVLNIYIQPLMDKIEAHMKDVEPKHPDLTKLAPHEKHLLQATVRAYMLCDDESLEECAMRSALDSIAFKLDVGEQAIEELIKQSPSRYS